MTSVHDADSGANAAMRDNMVNDKHKDKCADAGAVPAASYTAIIPARMASTRLPGKPLLDIAGVPMVVRVAQRAAASGADRVVVACDDAAVAGVCAQHDVEVVMTRSDHASGSDRLAEAAELLKLADDALVVNVQGDEPLIEPALIDAVAQQLADAPWADMASACHLISDSAEISNPNVVKVVLAKDQRALYFSRSGIPFDRDGSKASACYRHVGIYAYRAVFLKAFPQLQAAPCEQAESLEQLRALWHGHQIAMHICAADTVAIGVDTAEDLERVRKLCL